jgi:glycosyltransferase involved in cell wall biosynthesis
MKRVSIGIHVHAEPERLRATLTSVRTQTDHLYDLTLLPDGPDDATKSALTALFDIPQVGTREALGAAACFNRLVTCGSADVYVLVESGSVVGPGWLDWLLAAFAADPHNGLAGPTTNLAWNEQGVYPRSGSAPTDIARTAHDARVRFGSAVRTLEPLYSLADFCYVVRREVIDAVGAADEGYGLGPCWEMDYNIRAARAGWRGVWACAAYVHRAPFTARRQREESLRFEASKRHYQDKFCGARLRHEKADYRAHCRGEACANFAPGSLIAVTLPLPSQVKNAEGYPDSVLTAAPAVKKGNPAPSTSGDIAVVEVVRQSEPLVSCIMPTYNRRSFIPQALRCFLRQDYANLELIILDDGTDPVADCVPEHERIRYHRLEKKLTIGAKRNLACAQARGEFIVHWDDDDWYPSWRVSAQFRALLDRHADLCGSSQVLYYDADADTAWEYRYAAPSTAWVAGNTLAYRKSLWQQHHFPDIQVGEDSRFVWSIAKHTVVDLANPQLCIGAVHRGNTSRKDIHGAFWHVAPSARVYALLGDDRYFYRGVNGGAGTPALPLVSCIMPTYNRRPFVTFALRYFLAQDYPNKELVVVDDGSDPVGDLVEHAPGVRYVRLSSRISIGAKRNLACQHARGDLIAHWDDDDWYTPDRLRYQVAPILSGEADLTGLENAFVLELPNGVFWRPQPELHKRLFVGNVHGGTLVYRKKVLQDGVRYPEINLAEDAWLLQRALAGGKRLRRLANPGVFVYIRHGRNAWRFETGRFLDPSGWERIQRPRMFPVEVLASYLAVVVPQGNLPA